MPTKKKEESVALARMNRGIRQKEKYYDLRIPNLRRKGKPLIEDPSSFASGIVSHPRISTQVVLIQEDIYSFFEKVYLADPYVRQTIDTRRDYALQNDFGIYFPQNKDLAREVEHWMRAHGFYLLLDNFVGSLLTFGNAFLWMDLERIRQGRSGRPSNNSPYVISDHRVVHPEYMFVQRSVDGDVKGYIQKKTKLDLGWAFFSPKEMLHVPYRPICDKTYGIGIIEAILRDLHFERLTENDLVEIIHDYVAPLYHVKCGFTNTRTGTIKPASQKSVNMVRDYLQSLGPQEDIVTDNTVEINVVGAGRQIGDTKPTLDHFKKNLLSGLMPDIYFGSPEGTSQNVALVQQEKENMRTRYIQKIVSYNFETRVIPYILLDIVKESIRDDIYGNLDKYPEFRDISPQQLNDYFTVDRIKKIPIMYFKAIESEAEKHKRLREEYNSGKISLNEWRKETFYEDISVPVYLLGYSGNGGIGWILYNAAELPYIILQQLVAVHNSLAGATVGSDEKKAEQDKQRVAKQKLKGQRTPTKQNPATSTVDGSGQPVAKDVKTRRKNIRRKDNA